jgi:hypothetical protein
LFWGSNEYTQFDCIFGCFDLGEDPMPPATSSIRADIHPFFETTTRAIIRAEVEGRVPARFTGTGRDIWATFRNELTLADLVTLCIEDAGATMPIPFNPGLWWPDWPDRTRLNLSSTDADQWIKESLAHADQPRDAYLRAQAATLGLDPPSNEAVAALPTPARHERCLELPGTAGWLAYALSTRSDGDLYFWENFHVVCGTLEEVLLAGLIAWELGAPPRAELPIRLDDPDLTATLKGGETYHNVVGRRELHGHRDLRILHHDGKQPLWI